MLGSFQLAGYTALGSLQADLAANAAGRAARKADSLKIQIRLLESNLAKALMINEALWELMRERLKLTEDDLHNKLYEIDMRDGQLDGKHQRSAPIACPQCGRKVSPRHAACIYCGTVIDQSVFSLT